VGARVYAGFSEFIDLLQELVKRPRHGETPPRQLGAARRWGVPLLCLVRGEDALDVLGEINEYLKHSLPTPVPHALHEFAADTVAESAAAPETPGEPVTYADLGHVAAALFNLGKQLSSGGHKEYGRIRFRRFELTRWLMNLRLDGNQIEPDLELARRIRRFELTRRKKTPSGNGVAQALPDVVPWWARIVVWVVPPLWFRLRLRIGTQYRWFLRQSFLAPHDPGTFLGFAQRLTGWLGDEPGHKTDGESAEELLGLLVNAFLEDVRRAYRRRWRPRAARRTAYPVVLLDRITRRNGGYRLLETVSRIRDETGLFDPLLFVSASRRVPPDAFPPGATPRKVWEMREAREAYRHWRGEFWHASRERKTAAWYLPFEGRVAAGQNPAVHPAPSTLRLDPPPWWSRAAVLPTALVLLVALVAGTLWWLDRNNRAEEQAFRAQHCGLGMTDSRATYLATIDDECIGVSEEPIFDEPAELLEVQRVIADQNAAAERLRRDEPNRQFISVAYVSEMSAPGPILSSEVERLQGVAARQRRQLDGNEADPLVRILFVNAGNEMRHGPDAARMLAKMMAVNPTIVGAVGLAVSSRATVETIRALGAAGIPMIAAPLTADNLQQESPLYYQVSPQNRREAQMAAKYARHQLGITGPVTVVTSGDREDLYDTTLAADAREEFGKEGFTVQQRTYTRSPDLGTPDRPSPREVGQQLCGLDGLIFYTGRPADFAQLLDGINGTCNSSPPRILTGDDISRYVADARSRERFPQIPFDHLSLALGGQNCYSAGDLSNTLRELFPDRCSRTRDSFLTDDAPTAYDALTAIVAAVNKLRGTAVTPGAVWHMITRITGNSRIDGASGVIDFGRDGSQIPLNKFVAIMRVEDGGVPRMQATCGEFRGQTPAEWCP
jgi:ABC-type branched-subunit amino acid transport system substrate-binding protein